MWRVEEKKKFQSSMSSNYKSHWNSFKQFCSSTSRLINVSDNIDTYLIDRLAPDQCLHQNSPYDLIAFFVDHINNKDNGYGSIEGVRSA